MGFTVRDLLNQIYDATKNGINVNATVSAAAPGTGAADLGKAEDAQHGSGDTGIAIWVVRNDALAALAGTDGDYAPLQVDANGGLYLAPLVAGTAAIGKLAANSGVDIGDVTLTAGTNSIGKLAANSGVDIGDVTLNTGSAAIGKLAANAGVDIGDVGVKSYGFSACGERQGSASAVQLPSVPCKEVAITAVGNNVGSVFLGGASVTVPNGTTDTTSGLELEPGDMTQFIPVDNLNEFYIICDNAGDDITYLALA